MVLIFAACGNIWSVHHVQTCIAHDVNLTSADQLVKYVFTANIMMYTALYSLIGRPSLYYDRFQYAKIEGGGLGAFVHVHGDVM